jgi:excinuclease ABC subunit A
VTFAGLDFDEVAHLPLIRLSALMASHAGSDNDVVARIAAEIVQRVSVIVDLGLGYLSIARSTPTLSPGELQRLRIATQVRSNLFGVVYVLDEPSAGLHPADTQALLRALDGLVRAGNSLFVVEHDLDVVRHADWIVDVGPGAGVNGGRIVYSGPPAGLADVAESETARYLFDRVPPIAHAPRDARAWLQLRGVTRNNVRDLDVAFPLGVLTVVTGISGSGKTSLVSHALVDLVRARLGGDVTEDDAEAASGIEREPHDETAGTIDGGLHGIARLVRVDQKPIGRTPRSNLATYTGLFDNVRALFAATPAARARHFNASRFSFNLPKGRCPTCEGEGSVMVELLFLPSVYAPCPTCHGARYNAETLAVRYRGKTIADVLGMTVDDARAFFDGDVAIRRTLDVLEQVGLGYLRLGQPATEFSGGEAQRVKLAAELQRTARGDTLYVLDEPTTGLHPADVDRLMEHLGRLIDAGNTAVVIEHDRRVIACADWQIDIGPGAADDGGRIVRAGAPA